MRSMRRWKKKEELKKEFFSYLQFIKSVRKNEQTMSKLNYQIIALCLLSIFYLYPVIAHILMYQLGFLTVLTRI